MLPSSFPASSWPASVCKMAKVSRYISSPFTNGRHKEKARQLNYPLRWDEITDLCVQILTMDIEAVQNVRGTGVNVSSRGFFVPRSLQLVGFAVMIRSQPL